MTRGNMTREDLSRDMTRPDMTWHDKTSGNMTVRGQKRTANALRWEAEKLNWISRQHHIYNIAKHDTRRDDIPWHNITWHDAVKNDKHVTREELQNMTWQDNAGNEKRSQDKTRHEKAWHAPTSSQALFHFSFSNQISNPNPITTKIVLNLLF